MGTCMCSEREPDGEDIEENRIKMLSEYLKGLKASYIITLDDPSQENSITSSQFSQEQSSNYSNFEYSEDDTDFEIPTGLKNGEIFVLYDGSRFRIEKNYKHDQSKRSLKCLSCNSTILSSQLKSHAVSSQHNKRLTGNY
ncbi:unnamed protein product [Blepharisma stoltei]|uniref:C2H2-type domain-containing protein n=1 Tax=Blepharisma stoltei TaxID=1481888 RepID=A0AAU9JTN4_9CILI|nr:unnamed protein product [Blepharisma stoltei]